MQFLRFQILVNQNQNKKVPFDPQNSKMGGPPLEFIKQKAGLSLNFINQIGVCLQNSSTNRPPKGGLPLEFIIIQPPKGGPPLGFINIQIQNGGLPLEFINMHQSKNVGPPLRTMSMDLAVPILFKSNLIRVKNSTSAII